MKGVLRRAVGLLLLVFAQEVSAGDTVAEKTWLAHRDFRLENGLRVVLVQEPKAPVVVTQVWYRVGSVDEEPGRTGLSHMLEHMMFRGTPDHPDGEFSRIVSHLGGDDNASTSQDFTQYYVKIASNHLERILALEADRMHNLRLEEEVLRTENAVVQEERRSRTDSDPQARMAEKFQERLFSGHPYGHPIIGWMADIQAHRRDDLARWYRLHYAPNNAALVVVGDLDLDRAQRLVETYFASIPPAESLPDGRIARPPLPEQPQRLVVEDATARVGLWNMAFSAPSLAQGDAEREVMACEVLTELLGGGLSSRLYRRLVVEEQLAVAVNAGYGGMERGGGTIQLQVTPRSGVDAVRIEEQVRAVIERLRQEPVDETELQRVRNNLIAGHVFTQDSAYYLAHSIGRSVTAGIDWRGQVLDYPHHLREVAVADVQAAAGRYLDPQRATIGWLQPAGQRSGGSSPVEATP
ncbi:MAG: insulinase family protein [Magnetococcales bacterium]|nr:insulinase family protein [Magnetococcales bacterium]